MYQLEKTCFTLPWSQEQCQKALLQKTFVAFGAWMPEKTLVAYISAYLPDKEMEILNIAVLPQLRRQGLARKMLAAVLQAAHKMGMQKASLEVRASNIAAINLYESMGFRQAGIRKRYYSDNQEDALIYCREFHGGFF